MQFIGIHLNEDLLRLSKVLEQNFWFFTWDLESGYHYVDIFSGHQKFLGFSWPFSSKVHFFTFRVLPFGLNSACFCFMKLLRPLVKRRRSMGHFCFVYLDDGISGLPERVSAFADSWVYQKDFKSCGLTLNREKSKLEPMQVGLWLDFVTDTIRMQFRVPPKKIAKLKSNLDFIISSHTFTFVDLARVAGFIKSLFAAVRLNSRFILLFKGCLAETVHFLLLFIYWRSCAFGFLILRLLTVMGFSQSSPPEQFFFATPATMLSVVSKLASTISRGAAESNSSFLSAIQVLPKCIHNSIYAQLKV